MEFIWRDRINGVDDCIAEDVNELGHGIEDLAEDTERETTEIKNKINELEENGVGGGVSQEYVDNIANLRLQAWWIDYEYKKGDLVLLTGERYDDVATYVASCIEDHNSGYSIDTSKWEEVGYIKSRYDEAGNIIHETYATKEELENFTSSEKVYDYSSETTNDLILEHNSLYYFSILTALNLSISSNVDIESVDAPFECSILFTSGETATNLDYSASPIVWSGDDCDSDGHFVPEANKTYEISIKKLGLIISARVGVI